MKRPQRCNQIANNKINTAEQRSYFFVEPKKGMEKYTWFSLFECRKANKSNVSHTAGMYRPLFNNH